MNNLALTSGDKITIALWVLSGVSSILLILIAFIVNSFNSRLKDIETTLNGEDGVMSKLKNKIHNQEVRNTDQEGKLEHLNNNIEMLEKSIKELKKELSVISSALSTQFQTKDTCGIKSDQLMTTIKHVEEERYNSNKETKQTLKDISTTLAKLNNVVIKLETQNQMHG
jgi:chromosome segregation ATPase